MHSFERQYPNIYGPTPLVSEPPFATLSYTWSRFQKEDEETLHVGGIHWNIPSIDPNHFTATQLARVVQSIAKFSDLEYLWLDIACLNISHLDYGEPEVFMQQDIFYSATQSVVWLSETSASQLSEAAALIISILRDVGNSKRRGISHHGAFASHLVRATRTSLARILNDPWFSSLWTLLEGSVNPDAVLLSAEGSVVRLPSGKYPVPDWQQAQLVDDDDESKPFMLQRFLKTPFLERAWRTPPTEGRFLTLWNLILMGDVILNWRNGDEETRPHYEQQISPFIEIECTIKNSGLSSFAPFNLLYVYSRVQHRYQRQTDDRLKYISTVLFRFYSGSTPPNDCSTALGSTSLLDTCFSARLIENFPVLSQLYLRVKPAPTSSTWLLSPDCEIPDLEFFLTCFETFNCTYTATLLASSASSSSASSASSLTSSAVPPTPTFRFRGPTHPFRPLATLWLRPQWSTSTSATPLSLLGVSSDSASIPSLDGECVTLSHISALPSRRSLRWCTSSTQKWSISYFQRAKCIEHLLHTLAEHDVRVMLLARACAKGESCELAIGVVIVRDTSSSSGTEDATHSDDADSIWRRVGICFWLFGRRSEAIQQLLHMNAIETGGDRGEERAHPDQGAWRDMDGIFG
ncbi:MAG: hypothetical protein Q9160_004782 [Pyrenula sp. 1 TL-2023]